MTETQSKEAIVAVVKACEQYRFKVELPGEFDRSTRMEMRRTALLESNKVFLECTRSYQEAGWAGIANVSFADTRTSPSDSKSEFIHSLICLKLIQLSVEYFRAGRGLVEELQPVLRIEAPLNWASRRLLGKLCDELQIRMDYEPPASAGLLRKPKIGGAYRPRREGGGAFTQQPIRRVEEFRAVVLRRLTGRPVLKKCFHHFMLLVILLLWPLPIAARVIFSVIYRLMAAPLLRRMDSSKNVFVYFDLRLGKNRDVGSYLRWKYGNTFATAQAARQSVVPFSHLARPGQAYSFKAMLWSFQALRRMKTQPLDGCVVVNYLIPPWLLFKIQFRRNTQRRIKRRRLRELQREAPDFLSRHVYDEFLSALDQSNAFPVEVSRCYKRFFDSMSPGVVVQADAAAKTARHFTACARLRGGRVVYVADRICTELRTSNQFIRDGGPNLQIPDRCVVFDQVSRDEFLRQGMSGKQLYTYHRNFSLDRGVVSDGKPADPQVVILLQAYEDNIGAMVRIGAEVADRLENVRVVYQEHPNFPVCARMKEKLLESMPERLRFLKPGEPVDYKNTLALITSYSTAAVPGILHGVPLIWLRRQVDNSIFGEPYLDRIGFAADKRADVIKLLKRLMRGDRRMLRACAEATVQARDIFVPTCSQEGTGLTDALGLALEDSFAEIAAALSRQPLPGHGLLEPVNA